MADENNHDLDLKVLFSSVNLKEQIIEFLQQNTDFLDELKQNCKYYHSKFQEAIGENKFRPFLVTLNLNFEKIKNSGKKLTIFRRQKYLR